jgi:protein-L-isoaspartate(D-aspartate) O-methyltransferase
MTPRHRMVMDQLRARDIVDPLVLAAFARIPREAFVGAANAAHAYDDGPLPIGNGQTISQPYVVAITVQAMRLRGRERVLEVGTGSGYAAAILGAIATRVDTVERLPELARAAEARLAELGYANIHVHRADGTLGWPAGAPYDAIAVAASAPRPPPALLAQLAVGGRLVLPFGQTDHQRLWCIERTAERTYAERDLGEVRFVPLLGAAGWPTDN